LANVEGIVALSAYGFLGDSPRDGSGVPNRVLLWKR
jgi:hypothetical protein